MPDSLYALILAGGSGERFWPLSRRARPKQLLRLVSNKTLLEETLARLEGLIPNERILILTNTEQENAVRKLLPNFPKANIVAERDKLYGASAAKKTARADIPDAKHDPGADGWQNGQAVQLDLKTVAAATR